MRNSCRNVACRLASLAAAGIAAVGTAWGQVPPAWEATPNFRYNIESIDYNANTRVARVFFSVTNPSAGEVPWDIKADWPFTQLLPSAVSRLSLDIGWNTREYTNAGSGSPSAAAAPISVDLLKNATEVVPDSGIYVASATLPTQAKGTGVAAIEGHPALTFVEKESQTIGGFGRNDRFEYLQRFAGTGDIRNRVFVEAGTASGREPTERIRLQSYVGQFLQETGVSLGAEDEGPFEMRLLHFRRTFVEKMFALHAKVEAFKEAGKPIGGYARHYYDLFCLAENPEVLAMLQSDEYGVIKSDYDLISTQHFPKSYVPPPDMTFAKSDALFPPDDLRAVLGSEFEAQCRVLCFGPFPAWDEVQTRLNGIRDFL